MYYTDLQFFSLPRNTCPPRIYFSTAQHHIWKEAEKSSLPTWIEQNLGENASSFQVFRSEVCPNQRCGRRYLPQLILATETPPKGTQCSNGIAYYAYHYSQSIHLMR
jgi:hypothetical protein